MGVHFPGQCIMSDTDQFFVRVCDCGAVHLNFGVTVVNLTPDAAIAVSATLSEVTRGIKEQRKPHSKSGEFEDIRSYPNVVRGVFGGKD